MNGVRKVNVDTDLRLASTAAIRKFLFENPSEFDPRKYLKLSKDAMKKVVKNRLEEFGAAGHASNIKANTLFTMASMYQSGHLSSIVK